MKRAIVLAALCCATAWSGTAAAETKVGVGFGLGDLSIAFLGTPATELRAPVHLGSLRVEPSVGLVYSSVTRDDEGEEATSTETRVTLDVGFHYVHQAHKNVDLYVGPSLGFIHRSAEFELTLGGESTKEERTQTDLVVGGAVGVEYFAAQSVSIGAEAGLYAIFFGEQETTRDGETEDSLGSRDSSLYGTSGALTLRIYFL